MTTWLRMRLFLTACSGCILVSSQSCSILAVCTQTLKHDPFHSFKPLTTHVKKSLQTCIFHLKPLTPTDKLTPLPPGGGHPVTTNRTKWPITGGAVAFQPGWFQGHATAFIYLNMGFGTDGPGGGPMNMSFPIVPVFQLVGPSKNPYPGTMCLPQVPLPANTTVKVGDNATIQVIETALHGAALYSVCCLFFGYQL